MIRRGLAMVLALMLMLSTALAEPMPAVEDVRVLTPEEKWWNILLLGGDSHSREKYDRTDSIIILSVNRETGALKMSSIMRDIWVQVPGRENMSKINEANVYGGPELTVETVNHYFDMEIEDYVLVNMLGLIKLIDAVGGVDVEITAKERRIISEYARGFADEIGYEGRTYVDAAGLAHLNGVQALSYSRIRHNAGGDYQRTVRQQTVLKALAKKASEMDAAELLKLMPTLLGMTETNLSLGEAMTLATMCADTDMDAIQQYRVPADDTFQSGYFGSVWCIKPDFEENTRLLHQFIFGEE